MSRPHIPTDPESMMRLVVSIGYPMEETIPAMMDQYGMTEKEARDLYSRVTERILSAEEQASTP